MDDQHTPTPNASDSKSILPDVVHSQQIPEVGTVAVDETDASQIDSGHEACGNKSAAKETNDVSEVESISEHIPSKLDDFSLDSESLAKNSESQKRSETEQDTRAGSLYIPHQSQATDNLSAHDPSRQNTSWPDVNVSEIYQISAESPINLALSEQYNSNENKIQKNASERSTSSKLMQLEESPRSDNYVDSLNEESSHKSDMTREKDSLEISEKVSLNEEKTSSESEEIIKLDIRGTGVPKIPMETTRLFFGQPPEGSTVIETDINPIPVFAKLLSPILVGASDMKLDYEPVTKESENSEDVSYSSLHKVMPTTDIVLQDVSIQERKEKISTEKMDESDLLVEEMTIDHEMKEKEFEQHEESSVTTQPKSIAPEETASFSTLTTDYKTICEEYHSKLVHLEEAVTKRDELIEELTVLLQRAVQEREILTQNNEHLTAEVQNLQHLVGEKSLSEHDTIKAQISDFMKYQSMTKDDSTKFYSALMSGGSSMHSSNGERDMEQGEITVNYSKSDLKSSSDEFESGFENKVTDIISKLDEYVEENLRNKLRESLIQVLCDEISKMRTESDTELKELEVQMKHEKQIYAVETRRLRELLSSVKSGSANIDELRKELNMKHEKEMENLRMYFEKKCSDMERSYSEEVYRGRLSPRSASPLEPDAAGDYARTRRTRSADLPLLTLEGEPPSKLTKKYELQIEEMRAENSALVNELQAKIIALEEQSKHLKAHLQTAENTETNVSIYPQDIDLELEKKEDFERRVEEVRQEILQQIQDQIQVLLSDPDAELSSWPLELVALRDKLHSAHANDKELASLREDTAEADKWRQRRNHSFDQNRQIEEVTKERDGLKRVAVGLQRVVTQLVAYCAAAEDELNRTVLAQLLGRLLPAEQSLLEEESRPSSPNQSTELNTSLVPKHVHFAPDLREVLAELDEEGLASFLQDQRDLSLDIKRELEHSLKRLRNEAHDLLELSCRLGKNKTNPEAKMLESSVQISDLVQDIDSKQSHCDNCELHRKNMEEAMAECIQRESLLRSDLEAAMMKIAQLMTSGDRMSSTDLVAEGYGMAPHQISSSLPGRARSFHTESGSQSLDGSGSPRGIHLARLAREMDQLMREKDDLQQQLEAANRQLRSTRQFVEEQATEREAERDEFARRLSEMREENSRLATRLQNNARILNEVEQLEQQTKEMNQIIAELETRKASSEEELKATSEKISLLRDIISNLESQVEQKTAYEQEILEKLEEMRKTIDDRDSKMRSLLGELESLRSERAEQTDVTCAKCLQEEDRLSELMDKIREQCQWLEDRIHRRTMKMERIHEICSTSCSEPSEDVSLRDQKNPMFEAKSPDNALSPRCDRLPEVGRVWECLESLGRAEEAVLKRVADLEAQRNQLKDIAQEVRAERDVLQTRMSEQALKISSLSAKLDQQRNNAEVLAHQAASTLSVQLHDASAEVQRLKEELECKDRQLTRLKLSQEERDKLHEQHPTLYGNSCNPKDKVLILERELSSAQHRIAQLEELTKSLETDKVDLQAVIRELERNVAEREEQLQELLALKLEDENQKDEKSEILEGGKTSARTLSDIVSISDYDEQDQQMRRAELRGQNLSLTGAPYVDRDKTQNKTLPPEVQRPNMSSLNVDIGHFDPTCTPRADSLPAHLTSTQNKDLLRRYKKNVNETNAFGSIDKFGDSVKHSTAINIPDDCSMYPNRDVDETKNVSVEPKKINFSLEPSNENKDEEEFTSLRELGITLDIKQENFPDILTQLKHEIKKSRKELENCKSELKNAEEQLCEFPALKEEVDQLKQLLENTMNTMENDKKFYENQLESFTTNKTVLEQRLEELTKEVAEKCKDLHLLKEDILRRENMILELAKEKRNLTNKMAELEVKIDELQSRNSAFEKCESENNQMRQKISELQKLEQLVTEKNQQIDSLNQHLDRLDDLQRNLNDKTEEFENLKEAFEEKSNELFTLQDTVESLNRDIARLTEDKASFIVENKDLKLKLSKLEKAQENASLKLQKCESELERVSSFNGELTSKLEELKLVTDRLKDKETEIEILHEDISAFHEEIASLKEQLKMVSRSPSPRNKSGDEKRTPDRQASNDKKQLVKIRKQISLLQHELDFNKKELNDKAFELAKAKLDLADLKQNLSEAQKQAADKAVANSMLQQHATNLQREMEQLKEEKHRAGEQLEMVLSRIREESNIDELKNKLRQKSDRCQELENELQDLKELVNRLRSSSPIPNENKALVLSGTRSPTAELERAVRDQLNYSHRLDDDIMEQILSASSDEREDIPRLALQSSKSSSSIHSSSSERLSRMRAENEKLQLQLANLQDRLQDKDALITELNRIRDQLVQDWQTVKLRYEAERDNSGRLQLLLDTQKETSESLQNQDSNMIQILKKRLESSMQSELELQQSVQQLRSRVQQLERQLMSGEEDNKSHRELQSEMDNERLKSEVLTLKSRFETERARHEDLWSAAEQQRARAQRDSDTRLEQLRSDVAELSRLKHETSMELVRAQELINTQATTIAELERRLSVSTPRPVADALTEIEGHKTELAREIATLKRCLTQTVNSPEVVTLREERKQLLARVEQLERDGKSAATMDEKDHALVRYLHARCLRLESCRKALVWQKRYLQRVLSGYNELERTLRLPSSRQPAPSRGKRRFKCVAWSVVVTVRMGYLVRRRHQLQAVAANALIRRDNFNLTTSSNFLLSTPSPRTRGSGGIMRSQTADNLARRVLRQEHRVNLQTTPQVKHDYLRRPVLSTNSPQEEQFILSSPRGEAATAYLNKLDLVSRCLSHAMDVPRDVP